MAQRFQRRDVCSFVVLFVISFLEAADVSRHARPWWMAVRNADADALPRAAADRVGVPEIERSRATS